MMKKIGIALLSIALLYTLTSGGAFASGHGHHPDKKIGILLVAFGSSEPSAQVSFDNIDHKVKAAYPGIPVRWAYTSHIIRHKLAGQGRYLDSPAVALARMMDEKFTHVAVQSLHTILGAEYDDLKQTVDGFKLTNCFKKITMGYPLMATQQDMEKIIDAVFKNIPNKREKNEAVVFMGHGTHHPANAFYGALMFQLQLKDPNIYVGTVEGFPGIELIETLLKKNKIKKAYLMPFMSVAGDHAKNDMAGDENDSWKSILTKAGISCVPVLKGTAEIDEFADIWVDHLKAALAHF